MPSSSLRSLVRANRQVQKPYLLDPDQVWLFDGRRHGNFSGCMRGAADRVAKIAGAKGSAKVAHANHCAQMFPSQTRTTAERILRRCRRIARTKRSSAG